MKPSFSLLAAALTAGLTLVAVPLSADIIVTDAYARSAGKSAKSGAAFLVIDNTGPEDDRVIAVSAPVSDRAEMHTHKQDGDGVMRMMKVEEGFAVAAGGQHVLGRGGDHVMLMGLTQALEQGDTFPLTLTFEKAGDVTVDVVVDLKRAPDHRGHGMPKMDGSGGGDSGQEMSKDSPN